MRKGRILLICICIVVCVMVALAAINLFNLNKEETSPEITPMEEITEEQERQTMISLYYINKDTNTLMPEARVIDAKELLENPYKRLVEYLASEPRNEILTSAIAKDVKVNDAVLEGDVVTVDLSKEFADSNYLSVYAIVNTLTELNEVNYVKILIDGEEKHFTDENGNNMEIILKKHE